MTTGKIVVDNSSLIRWLATGQIADEWLHAELHAPTILDYEFLNALRGNVRGGKLTASQARETLDDFLGLTIERHAVHRLIHAMWRLRDNISAYDASYVALAEALGAPLVTFDLRLARAAERWCDVVVPS